MAAGIDYHSYAARHGHPADAGHIGVRLHRTANPDRVRVTRRGGVADVDIVAAGGEGKTGIGPNRGIVASGRVAVERVKPDRRVSGTGRVAKERLITSSRVARAGAVKER